MKSTLQWTGSMSVGIPGVDEEHQRFIARVNDLDAAIAGRKDRQEIERIVQAMIHEARSHFDEEERALAERGYPDAALHAAQHARIKELLWDVLRLSHAPESNDNRATRALLVKRMLLDHFELEDTSYRDFLRQRAAADRNPVIPPPPG